MTDLDHDTADLNPRTRLQRIAKWCAVTLASLIVVVVLALVAFSVVMSRVPAYRAQMQAWISERSRMDIEFSELRAGWRGYGPELVFTDAVVRSKDGQRVLARAEQGGVGFDLWQALRTGRLAAARFSLRGTEIKAQRRTDGGFEVVGQADWPEFNSEAAFKLDSLPVGVLSISDVRLSFRDLKTGRGPWLMDQLALTVTRSARVFDLQGQAILPETLGTELHFSAHGEGNLDDVSQLHWRAQVSGEQLDLAGWSEVLQADWMAPTQGRGSFEFTSEWLGVQGQRISGRLDFADVRMRLPQWSMPLPQADPLQVRSDDPDAVPAPPATTQASDGESAATAIVVASDADLRYAKIGMDFTSTRSEQGWLTQIRNLQLARESTPWPVGTASVLAQFSESDGVTYLTRLHASMQTLVLDNIWPLLAYLPETEANAKLRALNASGRLFNLAVRYEREAQDAAPRYGMRVEFAQLGISPVGPTPGINALSGVLSATGARGDLLLDSHDVEFNAPRVFRTPLPLDHVTGHINWTRTDQQIELRGTDMVVDNADGKVQAQFTLDLPRDGSPLIDLQAVATQLNAASAPRYMPAGVMTRRTLAWLDAAFPAGTVTAAQATLKGPLQKFPFRGEEGLFLIKAQIDGLTLNYQQAWLPATGLKIDAEFRNAGLSAVATAGDVNGLTLDRAEGSIRDYRDSEINITARTHGDLDNAVRFVQQSPVGPAIGTLFQRLSGSGEMQNDATLYFPLKDPARRRVDIGVSLKDATVKLTDLKEQAERIDGRLRIVNDAIVGADLRGEFLRGAFTMTTESAGRGRFNVVADGTAYAQPLSQFLKLPAWVKLDGAASYRYTMPGYPQRGVETRRLYSVDSDLRGLSINLPAPVGKPADLARNLHIDADLRGNDMQLRGALGGLRALVRLQPKGDGWRFDRAGLRADSVAAALPAHTGLRVEGALDEFVLDDWLELGGNERAAAGATTPGARVQDVLRAANVNIGRLRVYGFELHDVRGVLQATDAGWRVDMAGAQGTGAVWVPYEFGSGRALTLNMDVLKLSPVTNSSDSKRGAGRFDPRTLPSISADIREFHYGEHNFGHLLMDSTRTAQGLQVGKLQISGPSFNGMASGSWLQIAGGQQNTLALTLESSDVRATMQQFNYADFVAAKRGKLIANLRWPGGLDEKLLGRSSGTMELQVDEGQVLSVQPGAGRVLGLMSVAALPRRLELDFRDLTDEGLAFDTIHADFTVQNGDAHTENLLLRGPTVEIGIAGRLGLGARDYDQTAVVTGDVGAALPVAGVVAGGPVIGAALLLFTQIFKEPLKGVARAYYHIGGSWDDPQVERIDASTGKASISGTESP